MSINLSKIKLSIWKIIYRSIAMHMPISYGSINLGARYIRGICGKNILESCGKNINIEKGAVIHEGVTLGDNSSIGINCKIYGKIIIGNDVMMGEDVIFYTVNHNFSSTNIPMNMQGMTDMEQIVIGNDVWIGGRCIFLPGVKVGDGAVIGAGSIVTRNVESYSCVGGNPARLIRYRSREEGK